MHERRLFEVNRWGKDHDELLLVRASKSKQCTLKKNVAISAGLAVQPVTVQ